MTKAETNKPTTYYLRWSVPGGGIPGLISRARMRVVTMWLTHSRSIDIITFKNDSTNLTDPSGLCSFNIGLTNNTKLKSAQLNVVKNEIKRIFGTHNQRINFVRENANYSDKISIDRQVLVRIFCRRYLLTG